MTNWLLPRSKRIDIEPKTLDMDLASFHQDFNEDNKKAKLCHNVINERLFNVPLDQVSTFLFIIYI